MKPRPRVLVVSPIPSHPADQGNSARIQTLAAELKERCVELEFFYYGMEGLNEPQRRDMEAFWADFHFLPSLPLPPQKYARCWGIDDWCPTALCEAVSALHEQRHYDAVLVNYVWMSRVLVGLKNTVKIIDTHDLFGDRHLISIREGMEPRWFFTTLSDEERGFHRADLLIGIQEDETKSIRDRVSVKAITVGHSIPPHFLTSFEDGRSLATFGYLGSSNPWNAKCVTELDRALGPDTQLTWLLAGSLLRRNLPLTSSPHMLGFVAKLEDFYRVVDCVVNPMMGGTGLKIKTVEALAFGMPVIGTVDAFQGLRPRHGAHQLQNAKDCAGVMRNYQVDLTFRGDLKLASRELFLNYMLKTNAEITHLAKLVENLNS